MKAVRSMLGAADIAIVRKGKKTEPQYFAEIRIQNRVPSAHVKVVHSELGTQPRRVVDYAEALFEALRAHLRRLRS